MCHDGFGAWVLGDANMGREGFGAWVSGDAIMGHDGFGAWGSGDAIMGREGFWCLGFVRRNYASLLPREWGDASMASLLGFRETEIFVMTDLVPGFRETQVCVSTA
ncbi:hypothetical protein BH10BAC5_BH10BAC5_28300 [soil metagenome]